MGNAGENFADGYGTRSDLIIENTRLKEELAHMQGCVERLQVELANAVHNITVAQNERKDEINGLRLQVCDAGQKAEKVTTELKHVKKLLFERNRRFQEDCITINQLNVTIDTLVKRLAARIGG